MPWSGQNHRRYELKCALLQNKFSVDVCILKSLFHKGKLPTEPRPHQNPPVEKRWFRWFRQILPLEALRGENGRRRHMAITQGMCQNSWVTLLPRLRRLQPRGAACNIIKKNYTFWDLSAFFLRCIQGLVAKMHLPPSSKDLKTFCQLFSFFFLHFRDRWCTQGLNERRSGPWPR